MYQVAFSVLKDSSGAEDAVHQVFLKLLENGAELDPSDPKVKAYLAIAAKNTALNMLRDSRTEPAENIAELADRGIEPQTSGTGRIAELQEAISGLPGIYKEAVLLYYYQGYSIKETARITGISPAAVQKRLERARTMLKEYLEEEQI